MMCHDVGMISTKFTLQNTKVVARCANSVPHMTAARDPKQSSLCGSRKIWEGSGRALGWFWDPLGSSGACSQELDTSQFKFKSFVLYMLCKFFEAPITKYCKLQ